jgi:UDP-GlcNAc:undecaprenyl-phosphate/decaprenyl-phosphate GlcNAc-1-phosphate transferase
MFQFLSPIAPEALPLHLLFALSLVVFSALVTRLMLSSVRIMDVPNARSSHTAPTPKSGGISIFATFLIGATVMYLLANNPLVRERYFVAFVLSAVMIGLVSLYDDVKQKPARIKLTAQLVGIAVALSGGIVLDALWVPNFGLVALGLWAYPISLFWILGLTNAFNFMDGVDGLAAGAAVIVTAFFCAITFSQGSTLVYITCYTLLGGTLGFLIYNVPPARIFMGDVGSTFLGFCLAVLAIIAARYDKSHTSFLVMPLLLLNFIYDTFFTFGRRLLRGEKVLEAHRTHLYQLFNRLGYSHRTVSLFHWIVCALQGFGAVWMVNIPDAQRMLVFVPFLAFQTVYSFVIMRAARRASLL